MPARPAPSRPTKPTTWPPTAPAGYSRTGSSSKEMPGQLQRVDGVGRLRGDLVGQDDVAVVLRQLLGELGLGDVEQRGERPRGARRVRRPRSGRRPRGRRRRCRRTGCPSRSSDLRRAGPRSDRCAAGPARRRWRRRRRRRPARPPAGRRRATSSGDHDDQAPPVAQSRAGRPTARQPLRRLPGARRRDVNGRPGPDRCSPHRGRSRRPGHGQSPSPGARRRGAGAAVPRRTDGAVGLRSPGSAAAPAGTRPAATAARAISAGVLAGDHLLLEALHLLGALGVGRRAAGWPSASRRRSRC